MLGKLIGTGTLFAPPQLVDFDATHFKSPVPVLTAAVAPASRTTVARLRDSATAFAMAMYGKATAPATTPGCVVRENGRSPDLSRFIAHLYPNALFLGVLSCAGSEPLTGFFAKVGTLRKTRILAADETQGLVLMSAVIDHPGAVSMVTVDGGHTIPVPEPFRPPNTYYRSVLLKIRDGRIEHVEAITRPVFFGMDDGWAM